MADCVHRLLRSETESLPLDLTNAQITWINKKKGDRSDCNNYRGTSLLSTTGKILVRVLLNWLVKTVATWKPVCISRLATIELAVSRLTNPQRGKPNGVVGQWERATSEVNPNFKCPVCGRQFAARIGLISHMKSEESQQVELTLFRFFITTPMWQPTTSAVCEELFNNSFHVHTLSQKTGPLWHSRITPPKQIKYQWFLAERIILHLSTNCRWKLWYRSRTTCMVPQKW